MNVLMVGVGKNRIGGMRTVALQYINSRIYNENVNLTYVSTSTSGSILIRILYMFLGYLKIFWILHTKPIEIVHIHMAEKGSTLRKGVIALLAKKYNKKVIIHLHAGHFMAWFESVSFFYQKLIRKIFGCSDCVLVLGEYWKKELSAIIPGDKMIVLYNGTKCFQKNPYNKDANNIVYFGVMRKAKGTYDLIEAIRLINDKLPKNVKVILCGNDSEGNISKIISKYCLNERVKCLGWVTGKIKEDIYDTAMIDVLPSYYEGLSMTILEAMSRGIPVITTNISTMPEVLDNPLLTIVPGDIKQLSDLILKLVNDKKERIKISDQLFKRSSAFFSEDFFIKRTLEIYDALS